MRTLRFLPRSLTSTLPPLAAPPAPVQHDVLFMLTIRPPDQITSAYMAQQRAAAGEGQPSVIEQHGLQYVRGCEVIEVKDEGARAAGRTSMCTRPRRCCVACYSPCRLPPPPSSPEGKLMTDFTGRVRPDEWQAPKGTLRTLTVALDTAQYQVRAHQASALLPSLAALRSSPPPPFPFPLAPPPQMDMTYMAKQQSEDVYSTFNMLMRRKVRCGTMPCAWGVARGFVAH